MVVAVIALIVALAGTAYAAQTINGGAIKKQTIGGGKLKKKTLTGFQINTNKLGTVPFAKRADPHLLGRRPQPGEPRQRGARPGQRRRHHRHRGRRRGHRRLPVQHHRLRQHRRAATTPAPRCRTSGYAQTNTSPANPNAIEVHTRDKAGANEDADFHLIVDLPLGRRSIRVRVGRPV